jgi:phosphoglycerate dehydrogenase-like enzyme
VSARGAPTARRSRTILRMAHRTLRLVVVAAPGDPVRAALAALPAGVETSVGATAAELAAAAPEAEVVYYCSGGKAVLPELWPRLRRLRWLASRPTGVDGLVFPELAASDVVLTNSRGAFSQALAEWVLAAVLFFAKDLRRLVKSQEAGAWDVFEPRLLSAATAGIVGLGDIGRACAALLRAAGLRTLGLRRGAGGGASGADELLGPAALPELLARSDYVVLALPLTPETRHLIGAPALRQMRPGAVLVNVGRGALIDEPALVDALREGRLRGAALDVFEKEPLPAGHPFFALPSVLLSPHSADQVQGWREQAHAAFLLNLDRYRAGQPLLNVVDTARGY